MPQIQLLDEQTIDKIAAGEVVERPSSVVKELVENAIDARATAVTVEIKDGGTTLIRITDNGCGIEKEQIPIAFYRHSTSKIRSVEDLITISSLGFRGEALSSIAAVAQVELISKPAEQFTGCRYLIEGGKEISFEEIGAPNGTTFLVKNLFFNTPARRKFLKAPQTEAGYISDLMERMALSHPEVSFKFINNGQIRLHTSGNGQLKDIIYHIYGRDIAANLLEVNESFDDFSVCGFIGKPIISRGNRNFESYFINGRYIKSGIIAKAIEDAYRGFMMQHKYPFTVLSLSVEGKLLDVNVHPNKMELRFANGEHLYTRLVHLLHDILQQKELIPDVSIRDERKQKEERPAAQPKISPAAAPEPFEEKQLEKIRQAIAKDSPYERKYKRSVTDSVVAEPKVVFDQKSVAQKREHAPAAAVFCEAEDLLDSEKKQNEELSRELKKETKEKTEENERNETDTITQQPVQTTLESFAQEMEKPLLSKEARPQHKIIGQLFDTYWLVEYREQLYMIDQHAAHEKVLFEETMHNYHNKEFTSQMISPPMVLSLTMQEEILLKKYLPEFEKLGFEIASFGGKEYSVSAVPGNLYGLNGQELLLELMDALGSVTEKDTPDLVVEKIASMSCKAAVKGNQKLSRAEIEHLIDQLLQLENPYFCPHGRPVIVSMTKYEIEKKFKRIV